AKDTINRGFMGLEWAGGIPGRLGGAIAMNAGAYGYEIKPLLVSVEYIENGVLCSKVPEDDDMGYRKSFFAAPERIVVSAQLKLTPDDGEAKHRMIEMNNKRKNSQPLSFPSAGSVFKRPEGYFAGKLIQDAQLKGVSVGGAQVSEKHAGFIINTGNATCKDVIELIKLIQNKVFEQSGVMLEKEVRFIGREMQ
ncbi:MAG: UDP-N-acetylmuramate dehydrogenase, partial [Clostridia bacterium]|nr:UDP-N-acetylmuramate dehydrogenase [Clostridia bacterium]